MPVDKFGRSYIVSRDASSGITLSQVTDTFLRRDGENDMSGNLLLSSAGDDSIRSLGCSDLTPGKGFSLILGNMHNQLQFAVIPIGHAQSPLTLETTHGFLVRAVDQDICRFGDSVIIYKNVVMNNHIIKQLSDPTDNQDCATKNYVDVKVHKDVFRAVGVSLASNVNILSLTPINTLFVATQGTAGSFRLRAGLYMINVVGIRTGVFTSTFNIFIMADQNRKRIVTVTSEEFEFTAIIQLTSEANITLYEQHASEQLSITTTLVVERL